VPFHVELKDQREIVRAFNLSEVEVLTRFIAPLQAGSRFAIEDKEFEPRKARLIVVEGPPLAPGELGLGMGWTTARKRGEDVTQRFLDSRTGSTLQPLEPTVELVGRLRERILGRLAAGPMPLDQAIGLSADLLAGHRVSERLAAVETVVWQLLHTDGGRELTADGLSIPRDLWEATVLDASTWFDGGDVVALV
jgi:hypothetical protein